MVLRCVLILVALAAWTTPAFAQLRVTAVQWVQGNDEIPHPAVNGNPTMLQAIAEGGDCGGNYSYWWDINGDGDYDDANEGERRASSGGNFNGYFAPLGLDVQLPDVLGDTLLFPKVRVRCGPEERSATFPVQIRVQRLCPGYPANNNCEGDQNLSLTRRWKADRSVDRALWYMFINFRHFRDDGHGHNVHTCRYEPAGPLLYGHGHAMNAFLRRGHGHGAGRDGDLYYRHVTQCGVHAILTTFAMRGGLYFDDVNNAGVNGQAIQHQNGQLGGFGHWSSYGASAWVEPIASFGNPDYVAPAGPDNIRGRTLADLGQDLADGLVQCMDSQGGWYYSCQNGGGHQDDASTNGWPGEALRLLERKYDVETYDWAKGRQRAWLNNHCSNGICRYWSGTNRQRLSGNALVGYGWTEDEEYSDAAQGGNLRRHVDSIQTLNHNHIGLYYMYATTKGLRSFDPEIRYLPNGRDWAAEFTDFLLQQQAADGSWSWSGPWWPWRGSVNNPSRHAMITQIIQSWLEVSAYARATPELSGPGIDITFDHSWSYILDPIVTMETFRWNVIDYPRGLDLNGDRDFDDEGEFPPEDRDGNGRVEGDEIVWDFETDDIDEPFVYAYSLDLDWDDVVDFNVTLEVEDSNGRTVQDTDSIRIQVSLRNHKPVIIPHPDGLGQRYRGYVGAAVQLDGRESYDVDADHDVFPGDDERPEGIRDRVTSIHFDLNQDGDFDDAGEDGTLNPVSLTLREGQGEGDVLAVPMRVCDDGQWNGKCYDGVQRADCSECSFGSAPVTLVTNEEPPEIALGGPYAGDPGERVQLDLRGTRDPEGVLGVRFRYEQLVGTGRVEQDPDFSEVADNMGPRPSYLLSPLGDGPRVETIRVRAWDYGGLQSVGEIEVTVNNLPPVIDDFDVLMTGRAPSINGFSIENLGNGWYRARVDARPSDSWDAWAIVDGHDPGGDDLVVRADLNNDGEVDDSGDPGERLGSVVYVGGRAYTASVVLDDGQRGTDTAELRVQAPAADPTLRYFFDLGANGSFEVAGGGQGFFDFEVEPGTERVRIAGYAEGRDGVRANFDEQAVLRNAPPRFDVARILDVDGFEVVVGMSAVDPDDDDITYTVDWGDGGEPTTTRGGIAEHGYRAGQFREYTIRITADDGRGGRVVRELTVEFEAPPPNRAPRIDDVQIRRDGFRVDVVVGASDPDGDALDYTIDWGDGSQAASNGSGIAGHDYRAGQFRAYTLTFTVQDGNGGRVQAEREIVFVAPAENRAPVIEGIQLQRSDWRVDLVVGASDPDGDALTYTIDWGDDSEDTRNGSGIATHGYREGQYRAYTITVTVEDGRGGRAAQQRAIEFERPAANRAPTIDEIQLQQFGWRVNLVVGASDPDGDTLTYTIDWGDEGEDTRNGSGVASHGYREGRFGAYTITVTVEDGNGGRAAAQRRVEFERPPANQAPIIEGIQVQKFGWRVDLVVGAVDPDGDALSYNIDWGDDSETDNGSGIASHVYEEGVFETYTITVTIADGNGGGDTDDVEVDFPEPPANRAPTIDAVQVEKQGFRVNVVVGAADPDGDALLYTLDWGDDTDETVNGSGIASHTYPDGQFDTYTITATVEDGRGGEAQNQTEVDFPEPAENRAPRIEAIQALQNGWRVDFVVGATDPDGDVLTYTVDWGDDSDDSVNNSGISSHAYPAGEYREYTIRVTVRDGRGGRAQGERVVDFPEPAANRAPVIDALQIVKQGWRVNVNVGAADPDGDALSYNIDWGDEGQPTVNNSGIATHLYEEGEFGEYNITVTVTDGRGGRAQRAGQVEFEAPAANRAPRIDGVQLIREAGFRVVAVVGASDPDGDELTYTIDWGDQSDPSQNGSGLASHDYPDGAFRGYEVTVTVEDGNGGRARTTGRVAFEAPAANREPSIDALQLIQEGPWRIVAVVGASDPDADPLTYTIAWGDGSDPTVNRGGIAAHNYPENRFREYEVTVTVTDGRGGQAETTGRVDFPEPPANRDPIIETLRLIRQGEWEILAVVGAVDPDDDPLTFTIDWGDGSDPTVNRGGIAAHVYPGNQFREYTITASVVDGRGGDAEIEGGFNFPRPADNAPPVISGVDVDVGARGLVTVSVDAFDPEAVPLSFRIHWGDEAEDEATSNLIGGVGSHRYERRDQAYEGFVIAIDDLGNQTRQAFNARVVDSQTLIRDFSVNVIRDGTVLINVIAEDRDGDDFLVYSFDFTDDGEYDVTNQADSSAIHSFPEAGEHTIRVRVTDTWSGNSVEDTERIRLEPWVGENGAPIVVGVDLDYGPRGEVSVLVDAFDPENTRLVYRIHWGDEAEPGTTENLVGGIGDHRYGEPSGEQPYGAWVEVTDVAGSTTRFLFEVEIVDRPTVIDSVTANLIREGTFLVTVLADDADGNEALRFDYDFDGDGELELRNVARSSVVHTYAEPGDYTIIAVVRDPWTGAEAQGHADVHLEPWVADNGAPVIHNLEVRNRPRGLAELVVDASDPEGARLSLVVHWGDEDEPDALSPLAAFGGEHRYAFPADADAGPYRGYVMATDPQGASARRDFNVAIADLPTEIRGLTMDPVDDGTFLFSVFADDGDGLDQLRYAFDFDGDGDYEVDDQISSSAVHTYDEPGIYQVEAFVTDTWSGAVAEVSGALEVRPWAAVNGPPVIHEVDIGIGPRGLVSMVVDASDPDGGRLSLDVHWGDEGDEDALERQAAFATDHRYPFPEDGEDFVGRVVVTDDAGETAEAEFEVKISDSVTVIREIAVSLVQNGTVLISVSATDPDGADLLYGFDFDADGTFEIEGQAEPRAVYAYEAAGDHTVAVSVTDPWSGATTEDEAEFELDPWEREVPIADHLEGDEGDCLVFRIGESADDLSTKVDPEVCGRMENPDEELWHWDFGDGSMASGSEVGHTYVDDGIYEVEIHGGDDGAPLVSRIQLLIANVAPIFETQSPVVARVGERYEYNIRLRDPGSTDRLQLALDTGPDGMTLDPGEDDRHWRLRWQVPQDLDAAQVEVVLRAFDGHLNGEWTSDGGETLQAFFLTIASGSGNISRGDEDMSADDNEVDAGIAGDNDGTIGLDEFTGSSCSCDAARDGAPGLGFLLFLGLMGIRRRRR